MTTLRQKNSHVTYAVVMHWCSALLTSVSKMYKAVFLYVMLLHSHSYMEADGGMTVCDGGILVYGC